MKKRNVISILLVLLNLPVMYSQDVFAAARGGDVKRMEELVRINPDTVNARNASDFTPLIIACYRNQAAAAEYLLNHGAEVNAGSPEGPALLSACYHGNLMLAKLLVSHRADVNAVNENRTTALMYAVMADQPELVDFLLKNGADRHSQENSGRTAADFARISGSKNMIAVFSE